VIFRRVIGSLADRMAASGMCPGEGHCRVSGLPVQSNCHQAAPTPMPLQIDAVPVPEAESLRHVRLFEACS
jgi:hypothetical protein